MERIRDINSVKEGDLMYYDDSLTIVTSVDVFNKLIYVKLDNGEVIGQKVDDFSTCTFFRSKILRY